MEFCLFVCLFSHLGHYNFYCASEIRKADITILLTGRLNTQQLCEFSKEEVKPRLEQNALSAIPSNLSCYFSMLE